MRSRALVVALVTVVGVLTVGGGQVFASTRAADSPAAAPATHPFRHVTRAAVLAAPHHYVRAPHPDVIRAAPAWRALGGSAHPGAQPSGLHSITAPVSPTIPTDPPAPALLEGFQGTAQSNAIGSYGADQNVAPPDPNLAVGPNDVVEATNSALYFFHRDGTPNGSVDIPALVHSPPGWLVTDPRVEYDAGSGRFFFSVLNYSPSVCANNVVILLVSGAAGPTVSWSGAVLSNVAPNGPGGGAPVGDQPGLGLSANVVALTWNYFDCTSQHFYGSQLDIVQKSDLIANSLGLHSAVAYPGGPASPLPVVSFGPIGTQYIVFNNSDPVQSGTGPSIGVFAITGQPEQQNVSILPEHDVPITPTVVNSTTGATESALQNGGPPLQTDDDRLISAVWNNGAIWTAGNTNCTPSGDTTPRSCLNIVRILADAVGNVTGDNQLPFVGVSGAYLYYPAVSVDSLGAATLVFDQSSSTTFESIMVAGITGGTTLTSFTTLHTSSTNYNSGGCPALGCRWGDYSGAARDPTTPTDIWVMSEAADGNVSTTCTTMPMCWNTYIGRYTFAPPVIANLTPAAGPVAGGQVVTVNGSDFLPGTTATLGGSSATVSNLTPNSFQMTTPAHGAGLVYAQATDAFGFTPVPSASAGYIYAGLGSYVPLTPFRIYDTRNSSCVNTCGGGVDQPLHAGETRSVNIAGTGFTGAGQVPTSADAVVINVTAVSSTAPSFLTVYPNGTGLPLASNLNFPSNLNIANLVTVTLGQSAQADANREVNVFNAAGTVNLLVDVEGYFTAPSGNAGQLHPIAPQRICDTRAGQPANVCNQGHATDNVLTANTWVKVNVTHAQPTTGVPNDGTAEAVALNLTGVSGTASTFLSVAATNASGNCPSGAPGASNLNLISKTNQANRVIAPLGPDASGAPTTDVCVFNSAGSINFILDLNGWFGSATATPGNQYQPIGPVRICDTRSGTGTECSGHTLTAGATYTVPVAGVGGIPTVAPMPVAVIMNVTAVSGSQPTFLTVYPADQPSAPNVSDVNANANQDIPNLDVVELARTANAGDVDIFNSQGSINAIFDVDGWFQ